MSLRKNSTDKDKYVFYTQLEKGNFAIFEEYDFDEIMSTYRTTKYYPFDAILKYFGTLDQKKNGSEILKEKLQYLKEKGLIFSKVFNVEKHTAYSGSGVQNYEIKMSPMRRIFSNHERHKQNIYPLLFKEIIEEMIPNEKMGMPLIDIISNKMYVNQKYFFEEFINKLLESGKHKEEFTKETIEAILLIDFKEQRSLENNLEKIINIYLEKNPNDIEIWDSILKKEGILFKLSSLIKDYILSREDKDTVINKLICNYKSPRNNGLIFHLKHMKYNFSQHNLEDFSKIQDFNYKKEIIKDLLGTEIKINDNDKTKELVYEIMTKYIDTSDFNSNLILVNIINNKINNAYKLTTEIMPGKTLFDIMLEILNPIMKANIRGLKDHELPEQYIRMSNNLPEYLNFGMNLFYPKGDSIDIKTFIKDDLNIYLIPSIVKSVLKYDPEKCFEFDFINYLNKYKSYSLSSEYEREIEERIERIIYTTFNYLCKYIDKNNEYHDKLYFKDTTFYNNFIENDKIKGNKVLLKEKVSVQMALFYVNEKNPLLNEEQKMIFRNIIVKNANFLLMNTEMKTEDKEKLIELEKFILNNEISNNNKMPKARL
jgi:hypothetical protein